MFCFYPSRTLCFVVCASRLPPMRALLQCVLPTSDVKSHTETKASQSGSKITYGEFSQQQPWALEPLKLHFHHDKPFKRVRPWGSYAQVNGTAAACLHAKHRRPCMPIRQATAVAAVQRAC
jgi:hypothetical protein